MTRWVRWKNKMRLKQEYFNFELLQYIPLSNCVTPISNLDTEEAVLYCLLNNINLYKQITSRMNFLAATSSIPLNVWKLKGEKIVKEKDVWGDDIIVDKESLDEKIDRIKNTLDIEIIKLKSPNVAFGSHLLNRDLGDPVCWENNYLKLSKEFMINVYSNQGNVLKLWQISNNDNKLLFDWLFQSKVEQTKYPFVFLGRPKKIYACTAYLKWKDAKKIYRECVEDMSELICTD
jgi:hypothetical protein